eukprot:6124429-Pleurochrysis_carterae.AAC.1
MLLSKLCCRRHSSAAGCSIRGGVLGQQLLARAAQQLRDTHSRCYQAWRAVCTIRARPRWTKQRLAPQRANVSLQRCYLPLPVATRSYS